MCGITGIISPTSSVESFHILQSLTTNAVHRGSDASGLAFFVQGDPNRFKKTKGWELKYLKEAIPSPELMATIDSEHPIRIGIGHTRAKTQGDPANNYNNHPIAHKSLVVIHNGMISNDTELVADYNLKIKGEVDSRVIPALIHKFLKQGLTMIEAIQATTPLLKGSYAVALLDANHPDKVWIFRHFSTVTFAYNPERKAVYFATTKGIITDTFEFEQKTIGFFTKKIELHPEFMFEDLGDDSGVEITLDTTQDEPISIEGFKTGSFDYHAKVDTSPKVSSPISITSGKTTDGTKSPKSNQIIITPLMADRDSEDWEDDVANYWEEIGRLESLERRANSLSLSIAQGYDPIKKQSLRQELIKLERRIKKKRQILGFKKGGDW